MGHRGNFFDELALALAFLVGTTNGARGAVGSAGLHQRAGFLAASLDLLNI